MKILQVIPRFNPKHGGGVNVVANHSKFMAMRGHQVTIITTDFEYDKSYANEIENYGVKVLPFKHIYNLCLFIPSPDMERWLSSNINKYNIIHLNGTRSYQNNIIYKYAIKYSIPYVLQAHGSVQRIVERKFLKAAYDFVWGYNLLSRTSKVIALCESEVDSYKQMGINKNKIEIVPNGIDKTLFQGLPECNITRTKFKIGEREKIVLYLGRLHKSKGIDLLINAFAELTRRMCDVKLLLVGPDDGYQDTLMRLCKELNLDGSVIFAGLARGKEVIKAFIDADVFVTPKFYGFPITFVESCACGLPIVTTNKGDKLDWINNKAGLVSEYNAIQMAEAIFEILNNEKLKLEFQHECRRLANEKFSWDIIMEDLEAVYKGAINTYCRSL